MPNCFLNFPYIEKNEKLLVHVTRNGDISLFNDRTRKQQLCDLLNGFFFQGHLKGKGKLLNWFSFGFILCKMCHFWLLNKNLAP